MKDNKQIILYSRLSRDDDQDGLSGSIETRKRFWKITPAKTA